MSLPPLLPFHARRVLRASLRIQETGSGATRWLGVRVRNADGTAPGMPDHLAMGSVSEDRPSNLTLWQRFVAGANNRRLDARYIYLNGGPSPFPYLYDFSLNSTVYCYPDPNDPAHHRTDGVRYFYVFRTGKIISK